MMQSQNKSEIAMLAELVIAQGLKAEAAQKAEPDAQNAITLQLQKLEETLVSKLDFIINELAIIKSNTGTIMSRQISKPSPRKY